MIFVDRIAFGGVLSLSKEIGKIRHSTVTLLLTTITEVLTDAHMYLGLEASTIETLVLHLVSHNSDLLHRSHRLA